MRSHVLIVPSFVLAAGSASAEILVACHKSHAAQAAGARRSPPPQATDLAAIARKMCYNGWQRRGSFSNFRMIRSNFGGAEV